MLPPLNPYAFISYANEDCGRVAPIADKLTALEFNAPGFNIWRDKTHIIGGRNFTQEIEKAFQEAQVILIFLSRHFVRKSGFYPKELKWAEEKLRQTPEGKIAILGTA